VFRILASLLRFETTAPQRPKLGQVSKYLTQLKRGRVDEVSYSQNEVQSSSLKVEVLDFRHIAPFRSYNASKATGVENRAKISHFLTPYKI